MKTVGKMVLTLVALLSIEATASAATDKLVVNNTGGTPVFKVDDTGAATASALTVNGDITSNGGFFYDSVNKRLGVGTTTPGIDLHVIRDITSGGSVMFLDGIAEVNYGPNIAIRTARGTKAAMNASQVGDVLGQVNFRGAAGTNGAAAFAGMRRSGFVSYATENYTSTGQGTNLTIVTTQNASVTPTEKLIVSGDGLVYIGQAMKDGAGAVIAPPAVSSTNTKLAIVGDGLRITMTRTPATATAACNQGEISYDANYVYVCTGTNSWKRSALSTWP